MGALGFDAPGAEPELPRHTIERPVQGRRAWPDGGLPEALLLRRVRLVDREAPGRAIQRVHVRPGDDHEPAQLLDQPPGLPRKRLVAADDPRAPEQDGLSIQERRERLELVVPRRDIFGAQDEGRPVRRRGDASRHINLGQRIVTGQLEDDVRCLMLLQPLDSLVAPRPMTRRHHRRTRRVGQQAPESRIQVVDAREVVQDALVDAQAGLREPGAAARAINFDQAPAAQRAYWRQRTPVRLVEGPECERKRRPRTPYVPRQSSRLRGQLRVHLDAGTEEEEIALERAQAERLPDLVDRCRARHARPRFADRHGEPRRVAVGAEPRAQTSELGHQELLVGVGPRERRQHAAHVIVIR